MGIDISKFSNNSEQVVETVQAPVVETEVEKNDFDIVEYTNNKKLELKKSSEVEALTSQIDVANPNSILQFGKNAADGIAKVSDSLLSTIKMNQNEKNSQMLVQLTKIMDKFDLDDFAKTKEPGLFQKLFKKTNSAIEVMFKKYETLGGEVEKIQIELQNYEREIGLSNKQLGSMLNENFNYYNELQKYIVAGEMAVDELDNVLLPMFKSKADTGNQIEMANYQEMLNIKDMLVQRIYDLRVAENISIQTIPMLRNMQHNNYGLIRKINSAFVVTLPVFKQCLSQAILIKKQELQTKSLQALDDKTNELLLKNAQNVSSASTQIAKMATSSSIQIETLEKMHATIKNGIEETMRIEQANRNAIAENTRRLEQLNTNIINNR